MSYNYFFFVLQCLVCISWSITIKDQQAVAASYVQEDYETEINSLEDYKVVKEWSDEDDIQQNYLLRYKGHEDSIGGISKIVKELHVVVSMPDEDTIRVKILDAHHQRWEIPEYYPFPHFKKDVSLKRRSSENCCSVNVNRDAFAFYIENHKTGEILFDTRNYRFIYTNYYLELTTELETNKVYGFGERNYKFGLDSGTFTIWARDEAEVIETGEGNGNTYGQQPVGLFRASRGNFYTVLMRNSNAMDIIIEETPSLTFKIVGGVIDLIVFVGDKYPDTSLKKYHEYVGKFAILPFWSMGFHQSRWGYNNSSRLLEVVQGYQDYDIPLDVVWSDIDYMEAKEDFTIDEKNFPLAEMNHLIEKEKVKWVPIIDAGIKAEDVKSSAVTWGEREDIFVKNKFGGTLTGVVWPGLVYFVDFFNPKASDYWGDMLQELYEKVPFSGIWLDMNEVATFIGGEVGEYRGGSPDLVYTPGGVDLQRKTMSLDAKYYGNIRNFDAHNLFVLLEAEATYEFLKTKSEQPFVLSRSSFLGIGQFAANWNGDIGSDWSFLKYSIANSFNFQIFGGPFVGSDICGFTEASSVELCARWWQLGAFYTFSRNHHINFGQSQEPWAFQDIDPENHVLLTSRIALKGRYSLLKWYYSLFIASRGTGSIFRPLFFEFPDVDYEDEFSSQFLLGRNLMAAPVVVPDVLEVNVYFPEATTWFDFSTGERVIDRRTEQREIIAPAPLDSLMPLFIRAGSIIHRQNVDNVLRTEDLNNEFQLILAMRENGEEGLVAEGMIMGIDKYDEKSVTRKCIRNNCFFNIIAKISNSQDGGDIMMSIKFEKQDPEMERLRDKIGIYSLRLYGVDPSLINPNKKQKSMRAEFIRESHCMEIVFDETIFLDGNHAILLHL